MGVVTVDGELSLSGPGRSEDSGARGEQVWV